MRLPDAVVVAVPLAPPAEAVISGLPSLSLEPVDAFPEADALGVAVAFVAVAVAVVAVGGCACAGLLSTAPQETAVAQPRTKYSSHHDD